MNVHVARLDRALARSGELVVLRRRSGGSAVTCRAVVTGFEPEELVGGIAQTASKVIISPTEIAAAGWPDPPDRGDSIIIDGRHRHIEAAHPRRIGDELVRIELQVFG